MTDLRTPQYRVTVLRAVLFDLDGTLLDTLADIARTTNTALAEHGCPLHPAEAYKRMVGCGMRTLIRRATGRDETSFVDAIANRVQELYSADPVGETRPYAGIVELLDQLKTDHIPMAVLSNKPHRLTVAVIEGTLKADRFVSVVGHSDRIGRKPDPAGALEAARALGTDPSEVLFLGDTDVDMQTALRAGMYPVGVAWGFRPVGELLEAGARAVVDHPGEVRKLLGSVVEVHDE